MHQDFGCPVPLSVYLVAGTIADDQVIRLHHSLTDARRRRQQAIFV
jgi:hypothetical protein